MGMLLGECPRRHFDCAVKRTTRYLLVIMLFAGTSAVARADETLATAVAKLLDHSDKITPTAIEAVRTEATALRKQYPGDPRVLRAGGLALLNQKRYEQAAKALALVIEAGKADADVYQAKIWSELSVKQPRAALVTIDAAAKWFPAEECTLDTDPADPALATFLGRMIGYLEGPAAGTVPTAELIATREKLLPKLTPIRRKAFDEGAAEVRAKYDELSNELDVLQAAELAEKEKELARKKRDLEYNKDKVDSAQNKLEKQAAKISEDTTKQLAEIDANLGAIRRQVRALDLQFMAASSEQARLQQTVSSVASRNPGTDGVTNQAARRVQTLQAQTNQLNLQISQLNAQANLLMARRRALLMGQQVAGESMVKQAGELQQTEKKLKFDAKRLEQAAGVSPSVRQLLQRIPQLGTYEEFPMQQQRARLLEAAAK